MSAATIRLSHSESRFGPVPEAQTNTFAGLLMQKGLVSGDEMVKALTVQSQIGGGLVDILLSQGTVAAPDMFSAIAEHWQTQATPSGGLHPDPRLVDRLGTPYCLRHRLLPVADAGGVTAIACARPELYQRERQTLEQAFGATAMMVTDPALIEEALLKLKGPVMARHAETRVPVLESCRNLVSPRLRSILAVLLVIGAMAAIFWPMIALWIATIWAAITLLFCTGLKLAAGIASALSNPPQADPPLIVHKPVVSIIVALYREANIAPRLVQRLGRLDYPTELLDILLVVEEEDRLTRLALSCSNLPEWMRVLTVPKGSLRTKPRALNYALEHCRGSIVGIYDAEDAPDPNQIRIVVDRFYSRGPEVACLQGILDFYNPRTNWLARCFTIEYATWFRLVLPGLQRLGLVLPLGGTTLFFRRAALEQLGGWDAHNVTEDADLGIRLARHGFRTEMIPTVTREEANCRTVPWIKQRSRWLKGYMMTWAVHSRRPALLWHQLGAWRFLGVQVLFLGTLSQFLLMPILWSFWLCLFGIPHPIANALPQTAFVALTALFFVTELTNFTLGAIALRRSGQAVSLLWLPTMHAYFPLGALGSYKALWEAVTRPFYWDKTTHGEFDSPEVGTPPPAITRAATIPPRRHASAFRKLG